MHIRTAQLGIAVFWAGSTSVFGPPAISLAFALFLIVLSPRWPLSFEIPYLVFASGFSAGAVLFIPLTAVLWTYLSVARRWPSLERNWYTVCGATILIAVLYYVGVSPANALILGSSQIDWLPLSGIGAYALAAIFVGLIATRVLTPALTPGTPLEPVGALTKLSSAFTPKALVFGIWVTTATTATYFITSEMILPCADRSPFSSCIETVASRGIPYPFIQRDFLPLAFLYDLLMLAVLHSPVLLWVRARERAV